MFTGIAFALEHLLKLTYMDLSGNLQVSARGLAHLADCDRQCVELYVGGKLFGVSTPPYLQLLLGSLRSVSGVHTKTTGC